MKISVYFLFVLLLFSGNAVNAQEHLLGLDKVELDLSKQPVPINLVEIIDARPRKENIGWVQRTILNKKVQANFENSFEIELSGFINKSISQASEALSLIIKINSLVIWEKTMANNEFAYVKLDLDFYAKVAEEDFRHLYRAVTLLNSSSIEVTAHHDDNIAAAFQQCFNELALIDVQARLTTTKLESYDEIVAERPKEIVPEYPIFSAQPVKGIYRTFDEFINNSPSFTGPVYRQEKGRLAYAAYYRADNKKVKNAWGFSDGKTIFVHHDNGFFPLIQKEDGFVFEGYGDINHQTVAAAAVLGGAVGGAIAGATSGRAKTQEYRLNMFTGDIYSAEEEYLTGVSITAPATLQVYRRERKQRDEEVTLMINDSTSIALRPGTIQELNFLAPLPTLTICDKDTKLACITIKPSAGNTYYIEVSLPKKQEALLTIAEVEEKVGQFYLEKIKLVNAKK